MLTRIRSMHLIAGGLVVSCLAGCSYTTSQSDSFLPQYTIRDAATEDAFIQVFADGAAAKTRLVPDYMYNRLKERGDSPEIVAAFDRHRSEMSDASEDALIRALEMDFVHSATTSSLDLLNPELSHDHFRTFDWQEYDYPGGEEGPNEDLADIMVDALDIVSPERRANRSRTAVLTRSEVNDDIWEYLLSQWTQVPGEEDWNLNRHAVESYIRMRDAAAADGVTLQILSGHRDPERAARNAERAGNSFAVASFSSHSLGLAIDFLLPKADSDDRFRLTTVPMADVVAMRESPTHKWLHLYGYQYGWYPFQHEPWHWEYNPPGFREVFWSDYTGEVPNRD